jgi:hypothetical protein
VDGVILHQLAFPDPSDELEATVQINVQRLCTTRP